MAIEASIKLLQRRKVVLADGNARGRAEMARYLRSVGMEVTEAASVPEVTDLVRSTCPHLVVLDLDLPGDLGKGIRTAVEKRLGGAASVLLTCRAKTPKERLLAVLNPSVSGVLLTPCRPELMMERLARILADDAAAKTAAGAAAAHAAGAGGNGAGGNGAGGVMSDFRAGGAGGGGGPVVVPGNNSLLAQDATCPFHERETHALRFALRLNHIETESNFFDVPVYRKPVPGADFVDYHRLCVTVCPECYFASADPGHFNLPHDRRHVARPLTPTARYAIVARSQQRKDLVGPLEPSFFTDARSPGDAIKSLELALHCSSTFHNVARHLYTDELVRQGNYHLRIALLQEQLGQPQAARDTHIESAGRLLKEAFPTLPETGIPRSVYQVVATSIYLGDDREAHQYLTQLARLSRSTKDETVKQSMDRYLFRSAKAWEHRDMHRRPVVVAEPGKVHAPFLSDAA